MPTPSLPYNITRADLSSPNFADPNFVIDLVPTIIEFSVSESIHQPFLTGHITVLDDNHAYDQMKFSGVERLSMRIELNQEASDIAFDRVFIMTNIRESFDQNNEARVLIFDLMDEHAFIDATRKISKSYTGTGEDIITKLLTNQLGVNVDRSLIGEYSSAQGSFRYLVPWLSPLQAAMVIKNRITSVNGSPFFLTASLFDQNVRLISFDATMSSDAFNEDLPYLFSSANTNFDEEFEPYKRPFVVGAYHEQDQEDMYGLISRGGLASRVNNFNVTNGQQLTQHASIRHHLNTLIDKEVLSSFRQTVFNDITDYDSSNSKEVYGVTSSNTFPDANSIHDIFSKGSLRKKIDPMALITALDRNSVKISVDGLGLFLRQISVGETLRFDHLNSTPSRNDEVYDNRRSGKFLITEAKHIFRLTEHITNIKMTKLVERD